LDLKERKTLWRKLHNDELHSLYSSPNTVRVIKLGEWGGWDMWHTWGREEVFTGFLLGGPKGRPRHRWEDNIKLDLREIGINGANWIQMAQDRVQWQLLWTWWWTFRFYKESRMWVSEWVGE
jgi:hypothetical protein